MQNLACTNNLKLVVNGQKYANFIVHIQTYIQPTTLSNKSLLRTKVNHFLVIHLYIRYPNYLTISLITQLDAGCVNT